MEPLMQSLIKVFSITVVRYFIIAGIPFLIFYIFSSRQFSHAKIQARVAGKKDFIRDITHSMVTSIILAAIGCTVLFTPLRAHTLVYKNLNDYPIWWIPVSLIVSLVIHDTYFYWMHRIMHHKSIFRYTHLVHHQSTNPSPWSSYSFHLLEAIVEGSIVLVLAFVLPMHSVTLILFVVLGFIINVYGHLGYEIMPRGLRNSFLFQVINTSVYHNLHHSKFKGNYSLYFRWWDKWMKTENPDYEKEYDRIQANRFNRKNKPKNSVIPQQEPILTEFQA